ncbi:MAG TPA: hypothetical protein ENJ18_12565 [Nannocystis exedens]|nr:hypothetical protein [Nannocystis exedens]
MVTNELAVDSSGDLYLAGSFNTAVDVGNGEIKGDSKTDWLYVNKRTPDGESIWGKGFEANVGAAFLADLALGKPGTFYLTGIFNQKLKIIGDEFIANEVRDAFVAKLIESP